MTTERRVLTLVAETADARRYHDVKHHVQWVPRSVCDHTTKHPPIKAGARAVHAVDIQGWWLAKHPFEDAPLLEEPELL